VVAFNTWGGEPRADRPNGGFYVEENAETSKTLDSHGGLNPSASQGGTVVAQGFTYSGYSNQPAWMTGDRTDCLPASGHNDGSHQGVGVVAFKESQSGCRVGDIHATLDANKGSRRMEGVMAFDTYNHCCGDVSQTLQRGTGTDQIGAVMSSLAVRRLTPKECERLQGFPDCYTDVTCRGKPAADGPRYKALGNSMAVPVRAWIGQRIAEVEATDGTDTK
jgi:site-specific DNA-cytosine methylase